MFAYKDPTGTGLLESVGAINIYRRFVDRLYQRSGSEPGSGFVTLDALSEATAPISNANVPWSAFPKSRIGFTAAQIDANRAPLQDEYTEWRTEKDGNGRVTRVTFTTEFPEYFESLAAISSDAVIAAVRQQDPSASPTVRELFGFNNVNNFSPRARREAFSDRWTTNPWNDGSKGIMGLIQTNNSLGALFTLVHDCAVPQPGTNANQICGALACVPERNSDPKVCTTVQTVVRSNQAITLADAPGIEIFQLDPGGEWELDGDTIDINQRSDLWSITRNGRRATLNVPSGLLLDGDPIESGTQVSRHLFVRAHVQTVAESGLPVFAQTGNENRRSG